MKTLLMLGGSKYIIPVIKKAHELGIFVITCDYLPHNIAHRYSDLYINASVTDKNRILKIAKKYSVDGISSFACDPGVTTMAYVSNKIGIPSVGPYKSVKILQNKNLFRKFLKDNNFNVPKAKSFSNYKAIETGISKFNFPVIIKPVDSAGSKGVTKLENKNNLKDAFESALRCSISKKVIVEEFIEPTGNPSDSDCYSINGNLVYCSFSNQYFDKNSENAFTPAGFSWPTNFGAKVQNEFKKELQRLLSLLKMNTSIYNVEVRVGKSNKCYIMEVSPRGGGNRLAEMLYIHEGIDLIDAHVRNSVGLPLDRKSLKAKPHTPLVEYIIHSTTPGKFKGVTLSEDIKQDIVELDLWAKPGDIVGGFKGANESLGTIVLKSNNLKYEDIINKIKVIVE